MISYTNVALLANKHLNDKSVEYIPQITFDESAGLLRIEGESYHEYAIEFFKPVFEGLEDFVTKYPTRKLTLEFRLSYFNTSTARRFLEIFQFLEEHYQKGGQVSVKWYYEDDDFDIFDSGMEYALHVSYDFECLPL
ncbi:MAG: DUF1987 domain-containing protein [Bacteroidetes bacterium]|nr:MAG: DUF1987 domain-containing protein [Bacteroidota bacterium]